MGNTADLEKTLKEYEQVNLKEDMHFGEKQDKVTFY